MAADESELGRARALLGLDHRGNDLELTEVEPRADEGLEGVLAYRSRNHAVRVEVLLFSTSTLAAAAGARLARSHAETRDVAVVNGGLLFLGHAPAHDPDARRLVERLAQDFAGRE